MLYCTLAFQADHVFRLGKPRYRARPSFFYYPSTTFAEEPQKPPPHLVHSVPMSPKTLTQTSKFLSLVLRHRPELIGLELDEQGWCDTAELLAKVNQHGRKLTLAQLQEVVARNNKQRFAFSADGSRIRANQGHSIKVELGLQPQVPPQILFHGTVAAFLPAIRTQGLIKGKRHHVHLSADQETATKVGQRRGQPVILRVNAQAMHEAGHLFYLSENGVWLTDQVPPAYLIFPE